MVMGGAGAKGRGGEIETTEEDRQTAHAMNNGQVLRNEGRLLQTRAGNVSSPERYDLDS